MSLGWKARLGRSSSWGAVFTAALLLQLGCSSDDGQEGDDFGGYTGSLVPAPRLLCGLGETPAVVLPAGDVAGVVHTAGCADPQIARESIALRDASGEREVSLEPLGSTGSFVVRSSAALDSGEYEISVDGEVEPVQVAAVSALPEKLGTLKLTPSSEDACPDHFLLKLTLTEAAQAYAALIALSVSVHDQVPEIWVPYGELGSDPEPLVLPRCALGACLSEGEYPVRVIGTIAGEALTLEERITLVSECPPETHTPKEESALGCELGFASKRGLGRDGWVLVLLGCVAVRRRGLFRRFPHLLLSMRSRRPQTNPDPD